VVSTGTLPLATLTRHCLVTFTIQLLRACGLSGLGCLLAYRRCVDYTSRYIPRAQLCQNVLYFPGISAALPDTGPFTLPSLPATYLPAKTTPGAPALYAFILRVCAAGTFADLVHLLRFAFRVPALDACTGGQSFLGAVWRGYGPSATQLSFLSPCLFASDNNRVHALASILRTPAGTYSFWTFSAFH